VLRVRPTPTTGQRLFGAQHRQRVRGSRVARDDDRLHALGAQELGDLVAVRRTVSGLLGPYGTRAVSPK
jgi:hypothetical protein